jgi:hypothetical protein
MLDLLDYRGYRIGCRASGGFGTNLIRRFDGSWRESPPTLMESAGREWVVLSDELEELAIACSPEEAKKMIDGLTDPISSDD